MWIYALFQACDKVFWWKGISDRSCYVMNNKFPLNSGKFTMRKFEEQKRDYQGVLKKLEKKQKTTRNENRLSSVRKLCKQIYNLYPIRHIKKGATWILKRDFLESFPSAEVKLLRFKFLSISSKSFIDVKLCELARITSRLWRNSFL